jgi:uncharacterized protein (DUF1810 family)
MTPNLARFLDAQETSYRQALAEIAAGRKRGHWMWFIFPQIRGLGSSSTSKLFAIEDLEEARAFLDHPVLGHRLRESAAAVIAVEDRSAHEIFGSPDDLKLRSCATLFAEASSPGSVFHQVLDKFYGGVPDPETVRLLGGDNG